MSKFFSKSHYFAGPGIILFAICQTPALAIDVTISISGTVLGPPCVINNNNDISVDLGSDLLTSRIPASSSTGVTGNLYETQIPYLLDCTTASSNSLPVQMQMGGATASFDGTVLQTTNASLGLELRHGGTKVKPGDWFALNGYDAPSLTVVPVKSANGALSAGEFSASMTLTVDYQ